MMQAIVQTGYGGPERFELQEVAMPAIGDDGVLVRVEASSVNAGDWRIMRGRPRLARPMMGGLRRPKQARRGTDVAGVVEAIGAGVTKFAVGDAVVGAGTGAFAEYVAGVERHLVLKPAPLSFEEAAAIPVAGVTALQGLRDVGRLQPGQRVLINGAAGGVGSFAVQLAKVLGAAHVTGVCSTRNVDLVRSLGADDVVDYTREDFTRRGERFDLLFDIVGNRPLKALRRAVTPEGRIVLAGGKSLWLIANGALRSKLGANVAFFTAKLKEEDIAFLAQLAADHVLRPVVEQRVMLRDVPEAVDHLAAGHGRAKTVVTLA